MNRSRLFAAASLAVVAISSPLVAQSRPPAELPPASFTGQQFVDSRGCAYVRAGLSGQTVWVARVNQNRTQICGMTPSFGHAAAPTVNTPPASATPPAQTAAAAPPPRAAVTPPPRAQQSAPIETVASLTTTPRVGAQAPAAAAQGVTLAQACAGRSGVQAGLINARTGEPIDCGPAVSVDAAPVRAPVQVAAPAAATVAPRPVTLAEACAGRTGPLPGYVNAATGQPVSCGPATPAPVAAAAVTTTTAAAQAPLTLAQACAGRTGPLPGYVNAATGQPVACGPVTAPAPLTYAATTTAACPPGVLGGVAYRCGQGGGWVDPLSSSTLSLAGVARAAEQPTAQVGFGQQIPASNPAYAAAVVAPPAGYAPVWDDGRLNPQRGLTTAAPVAERVVTRAPAPQVQAVVPQQQATPVAAPVTHRYVQVGTYGDPANAERALATLRSFGLPTIASDLRSNGRVLQVVAAGPFADAAALRAALQTARSAGYGDAFTRN